MLVELICINDPLSQLLHTQVDFVIVHNESPQYHNKVTYEIYDVLNSKHAEYNYEQIVSVALTIKQYNVDSHIALGIYESFRKPPLNISWLKNLKPKIIQRQVTTHSEELSVMRYKLYLSREQPRIKEVSYELLDFALLDKEKIEKIVPAVKIIARYIDQEPCTKLVSKLRQRYEQK